MTESKRPGWKRELQQVGLGRQILFFAVCLYLGHKLTALLGPQVAALMRIEYEDAQREAIELAIVCVVAIVGVLIWRSLRRPATSDRLHQSDE